MITSQNMLYEIDGILLYLPLSPFQQQYVVRVTKHLQQDTTGQASSAFHSWNLTNKTKNIESWKKNSRIL